MVAGARAALAVLLLLLSCAVCSKADALPCADEDGTPCDDGYDQTTSDVCLNSQCVGTCVDGTAWVAGACIPLCPVYDLPVHGQFQACNAPNIVGSSCEASCQPPAVPSGDTSRTCLISGGWSGVPLTCSIPNPCLSNPCLGVSTCVEDETSDSNYHCQCLSDARGTPGPDGSGCMIANIEFDDGSIITSVSDKSDIKYIMGAFSTSMAYIGGGLDSTIAPDGTIDKRVADAVQARTLFFDGKLSQMASTNTRSITASSSSQIVKALTQAAADANTKRTATISTASSDAAIKAFSIITTGNSQAAMSLSTATAQMMSSIQAQDSTAKSSSIAYSDATQVSVAMQVSSALSTLGSTQVVYASTSSSVAATSTMTRAFSTQVTADLSASTSQMSSSTSTIVKLQAADVTLDGSLLSLQNNIATASASVNTLTPALSMAISTSNSQIQFTITALSTQINQVQTCGGTNQVYDKITNTCRGAMPILWDYSAVETCSSTLRGQLRWNPTSVGAVVCNGTAWVSVYAPPLGSVANPATSCAAIVAAGAMVYGSGTYYIRLTDGTSAPIVCEGSASLGGNGQTALRVSSSCAALLKYFNVLLGYVYVDSASATPDPAKAVYVYCLNGVSQGGSGATALASGNSCNTIQTYFASTPAFYYVAGTSKPCFMTTLTSCQHALTLIPTIASGLYSLTSSNIPAWCEITGSEGWTLIMKVDGTKTTFLYDSIYWSNTDSFNDGAAATGLDYNELKSPLFSSLPFNNVKLGMRGTRTSGNTNWATFAFTANHLYACLADNVFRAISLDRNAWKTLVGSGTLQPNCNRSGFNSRCDNNCDQRVRIGILGNNENECASPDSRLGIGGYGNNCGTDTSNSCGNECQCGCDNSSTLTYKTFAYVMVR